MITARFTAGLGVIFLLGLLVPALGSMACLHYLPEWRWQQEACHAAIESAGSCIALALAALLLMLWTRSHAFAHHLWMACALTGMGILDGFHAVLLPGNQFVWLRSMATLVGGCLFALVWLPPLAISGQGNARLPSQVAVAALAFGLLSLLLPDALPLMVQDGQFTIAARIINLVGGVGFLIAAARFVVLYYAQGNPDDFLFSIHCTLFGAAGLLFELSLLWDAGWWWWHLLRLVAYGVALRYVVVTYQRTEEELWQLNQELEKRVAARTAEVEQRSRELARSNAELELFAYVASHDLQEPLRMVTGYLDLLAKKYQGQFDEKTDRWVHYAVDGAKHMKQLINDLLEYSRVGTRGKPFAPTDCNQVFAAALQNLEPAIRESQAVVTHGFLPTVEGDRTQLTQLLQNLIANSLKFCTRARPEVYVEAKRQEGCWVFALRDNGIGIDPKFAETIFAIFKRLHTRQEYPGTGIGLAVCKKIVERHGGLIWVQSQEGQGATFYFTIADKKEEAT